MCFKDAQFPQQPEKGGASDTCEATRQKKYKKKKKKKKKNVALPSRPMVLGDFITKSTYGTHEPP